MNKTEQAAFEQFQREVWDGRALGWSQLPAPERVRRPAMTLAERETRAIVVMGWDFNEHRGAVYRAWSTSTSHGYYNKDNETLPVAMKRGGSQGPCHMYATKLDALVALRLALERWAAKTLGGVDRKIADARLEELNEKLKVEGSGL